MSALAIASFTLVVGIALGWAAARRYFSKTSQVLVEPKRDRTIEDIVREVAE